MFLRYGLFLMALLFVSTASPESGGVIVRVLSGRPDMVSGGNALVEVRSSPGINLRDLSVVLNNHDESARFRAVKDGDKLVGLVDGLRVGKNVLSVKHHSRVIGRLELIDYPITGPIFSGPHQEPFACEPQTVHMGPPLDADCSLPTKIEYYYYSSLPPTKNGPVTAPYPTTHFRRYDLSAPRPTDMVQTTTTEGHRVDFIVRREVGTINRGIYSIAFLYQPGQPLPDPWTKIPGWNGRLVYSFQGGCAPGYRQGETPPPLSETVLAKGFAEAGSTLSTFGNNANDVLSAETMMMVKEHFIKEYGVPVHTIGNGGSGGSMQQYLIAQNYPGLLDALSTDISFPDTFSVVPGVVDCTLFARYFSRASVEWTPEQQLAVTGFSTPQVCKSWIDAHFSPGWVQANSCISVPPDKIYDPVKNPTGVRCDLYDNQINLLGRDPKTGYARRPLDNEGVQYGLSAFNHGEISADEFLELNERMGGFDLNGDQINARMNADPETLRIAYESGRINMAGGSLGTIPIIDSRHYRDVPGNLHDKVRTYEVQARLRAAYGTADNMVIFTQPPRTVYPLVFLDEWLDAIARDNSNTPAAVKVQRDKPVGLADACWTKAGQIISEPQTYDGPGKCNELYPTHADPRIASGAPLTDNILKCSLKPVDRSGYARPLTQAQYERLEHIFPTGVCDYSKPGVGQQSALLPWRTY
ncbi:MAG TPA: DUF6351 family protein [Bryobacteraceae bacterium]|jgi:hypothetical protein|nr:DUF6351 family protein [Bryobacteraceae bacterium]